MLYFNAQTPVEMELYRQLKQNMDHVSQINTKYLIDLDYLERHYDIYPSDTLLYSFMDFSFYDFLPSFQNEVEWMEIILKFANRMNFKKIVLITHPGVYYNANNLFLQHKAIIQQMVASSGIPYTMLAVHALSCFDKQIHSLHSMYYVEQEQKYVIPNVKSKLIYNLEIENLVLLLSQPVGASNKTYDVFDLVYTVNQFLEIFSEEIPVISQPTVIYKVFSFLADWHSPTMQEVLVTPLITMHKSRVERDFNLNLTATSSVRAYQRQEKRESLHPKSNRNEEDMQHAYV